MSILKMILGRPCTAFNLTTKLLLIAIDCVPIVPNLNPDPDPNLNTYFYLDPNHWQALHCPQPHHNIAIVSGQFRLAITNTLLQFHSCNCCIFSNLETWWWRMMHQTLRTYICERLWLRCDNLDPLGQQLKDLCTAQFRWTSCSLSQKLGMWYITKWWLQSSSFILSG